MNGSVISVIVPAYNNESTIRRCADSVLNQTDRKLQLVLVDDGSQDGTGAICDEYAAKDDRVKVIHKQNEGLMATWMRGLKESSGGYVSFLDADDWIEPEMFSRMRACLTEDTAVQNVRSAGAAPREVVCCSYTIDREWNHSQEKKTHAAKPGIYEGQALQEEIKNRILGNEDRTVILSRCMKLISRKLLEDNLKYCDPSIRMAEDVNIMTPVLLDAERVVLMEDAYFYHYTYSTESMVHRYDAGMYDGIVRLRDILSRVLQDKQVPGGERMLQREFLFLLLIEMKNELRRPAGRVGGVSDREVVHRIYSICKKENTPVLVRCCPEGSKNTANALILWMLKNPGTIRISLVRTIFMAQTPQSRQTGYRK